MAAVKRYRPGKGRDLITRAPCLYPGCRRVLDEQAAAGGRQRMFCGTDCRANFYNIQRQLTAAVAELEHAAAAESDPLRAASLARDLRLIRWHLLRYRELRP